MTILKDANGRVHDYLRVSITDNCNFNCMYCNPAETDEKHIIKNSELLSYESLVRLIRIFLRDFGFKKIRITGGEPFARKDAVDFLTEVGKLKADYDFTFGITTNGSLLRPHLHELKEIGLDSINLSIDSLERKTYKQITGYDNVDSILTTIRSALLLGFDSIKLNTVVLKGINSNELISFVDFAMQYKLPIKFIEYMPFSRIGYDDSYFMPYTEMMQVINTKYNLRPLKHSKSTTSKDFRIKYLSSARVSFITAISDHFCAECNRLRVTSTGSLRPCLFSRKEEETDLYSLLTNQSVTDAEIANLISNSLHSKNIEHPDLECLKQMADNHIISIGG